MTSVIVTRALVKRYGALRAVDGIDLDVRAGDVYGFLGANGSGKTTTVRMLLGLVLPTSGERVLAMRSSPALSTVRKTSSRLAKSFPRTSSWLESRVIKSRSIVRLSFS